MSHATVEHLLVASESKIRHALGALRLAHAAREGVVALLALGVPHESPLLAILTFSVRSYASAIALWLVAESKEVRVTLWAVLVAHWTNTSVAWSALWITESKHFIFIWLTLR